MENELLLVKYFPKNFDEVCLPKRIKTIINKNISQQGYRLLLFSSPGTGKSTTSRLMTINDEVLYLSGSNDFKIEKYHKIVGFAGSHSALNKQKTVVIDEADNIRDNLQDAFKIVLDQCKNVNFIFITNEVEEMNDAIRSRCTNIDYDFVGAELEEQKQNFVKFILDVCKKETITYDTPGIKALYQLNFPDFRHILVNLQELKDTNEAVTIDNVKKFSEVGKQNLELYKLIETPSITGKELFAELTKFKGREKDCILSLGEPFFLYLNEKGLFSKTLESALIVSKYTDSFVGSINKFVTFMACIIELKSLFK